MTGTLITFNAWWDFLMVSGIRHILYDVAVMSMVQFQSGTFIILLQFISIIIIIKRYNAWR